MKSNRQADLPASPLLNANLKTSKFLRGRRMPPLQSKRTDEPLSVTEDSIMIRCDSSIKGSKPLLHMPENLNL